MGAWESPDLGTHAKASSLAAGRWPCWPRPLVAGWAALGLHWPERVWVRVVLWARPSKERFIFLKLIFNAKTIPGKIYKLF
jgi:hypothetical protein